MPKPPVDLTRCVKAQRLQWAEPPMELYDSRWYGPPGAMLPYYNADGKPHPSGLNFLICCPGCGQLTGARDGAKWTITAGSEEDVTTLTTSPSHLMNCCGWHGYLTNGVFQLQR